MLTHGRIQTGFVLSLSVTLHLLVRWSMPKPAESPNDTQIHTQMDCTFALVLVRWCASVGARLGPLQKLMLFVFRNCNPLMRTAHQYCYKWEEDCWEVTSPTSHAHTHMHTHGCLHYWQVELVNVWATQKLITTRLETNLPFNLI